MDISLKMKAAGRWLGYPKIPFSQMFVKHFYSVRLKSIMPISEIGRAHV